MKAKLLVSVAAALLALPGLASAQTAVIATTDLNIRSGPGPEYPVIGVIAGSGDALLHGCLEASSWCQISYEGIEGWAFSDYLIADSAGAEVIVTERPVELPVPIVTHERTGDGAAVGGVTGAAAGVIAGAIVGGPAGAALGGIAGAAGGSITGSVIDPGPEVRTYVEQHPIDPVYLEGEVVVGATLPETVVVREIPDYEYRYVYVNGQPVLVEADTRRIVYVIR